MENTENLAEMDYTKTIGKGRSLVSFLKESFVFSSRVTSFTMFPGTLLKPEGQFNIATNYS